MGAFRGYSGTGWAIVSHYPESQFAFAAAINTNFYPEEARTLRHKIMPVLLNIDWPEMDTSSIADIEIYPGKYAAVNRFRETNPSIRILSEENGMLVWDDPNTAIPGAWIFPLDDHTFTWEAYPFDEFKFHLADGKVITCSEYNDGFL